jgi:peptidoglycan/LPS O-acetylase OafA/YrhL
VSRREADPARIESAPSGDNTNQRARVRELDGLRGVAVLTVVVYHAQVVLIPSRGVWLRNGFLGVDLFFVLSGFLITSLLVREYRRRGRVGVGAFYRRRAMRLLPALAVFLVALVVYKAIRGGSLAETRDGTLSVLFYYSNWRFAKCLCGPEEIGHLWSLAVEEQFYLIWPFLLLVLLTAAALARRLSVAIVLLVVAIVAVVLARIRLWEIGAPPLALYERTDTRADSLLIGALVGLLWAYGRMPKRGLAVAATVAAIVLIGIVVAPNGLFEPFFYVGGFTLVAAACAALIMASLESGWFARRWLRFRPLCVVGLVSYGLYLWHLPVFIVVADFGLRWPGAVRVMVAFTLTAAATTASWILVERPFNRWKSRIEATHPNEEAAGATRLAERVR